MAGELKATKEAVNPCAENQRIQERK